MPYIILLNKIQDFLELYNIPLKLYMIIYSIFQWGHVQTFNILGLW